MNKYFYFTLVLIIITHFACKTTDENEQLINWKKLESDEEARQEIKKRLPQNANYKDVWRILEEQQVPHSYYKGIIYAKLETNSFLNSKTWLMEFYFDSLKTLDSMDVRRGYTGF